MTSFWNRFKGFYQENRLLAKNAIKADGKVLTEDDPKSRYAVPSDIVMCLHMAHPQLPVEIKEIFSAKLENQDLASLEQDIFTRPQMVLNQLEAGTTIRRTVPPSSQARQQHQRGASANNRQPRRPSKPEFHCSSCLRCPEAKLEASTHFLKDCPHLSQADRSYLLRLHDRALQNCLLSPEDRDTEVTVEIISMVEDYILWPVRGHWSH